MRSTARTLGVALPFFVGAMGITLLCATALFGVPRADLPGVALLLLGAGGGVGLAALLLLRPVVLARLGGVRGHLVGAALVGSLLLLGMVLASARAMFISEHDRSILLTMLLFASLLAVGFSLYGAAPLARRVEQLRRGTARLAAGDLGAEVPAEGRDELARLAEDFNRMAQRLAEASDREKEAEKSRRDLVAAVSHDLRTPLTSARALIEAVADGVVEDPETQARYLASARSELEKLGRLVEDLFELSRIDAGALRLNLEAASLGDLISDTLSGFKYQAENRGVSLVGEAAARALQSGQQRPPSHPCRWCGLSARRACRGYGSGGGVRYGCGYSARRPAARVRKLVQRRKIEDSDSDGRWRWTGTGDSPRLDRGPRWRDKRRESSRSRLAVLLYAAPRLALCHGRR
jgi:signal transduction histidine kinase